MRNRIRFAPGPAAHQTQVRPQLLTTQAAMARAFTQRPVQGLKNLEGVDY
jgi:hypothetical protein